MARKMLHAAQTGSKLLSFISMGGFQAFIDDKCSEIEMERVEVIGMCNPDDLYVNVNVLDKAADEYLKLYDRAGMKPVVFNSLDEFLAAYGA